MAKSGKGRFSARRSSRRRVIQLLYAHEIGGMDVSDESMEAIRSCFPEPEWKEDETFTSQVIGLLSIRLFEVDSAISAASTRWRIDRMDRVVLSILRGATIEMMGLDTPHRVVINEAIELAKEFGAEDSPRFVNGVLDRISKSL